MKAKTLGRNLKRTLNSVGRGYSYGRGFRTLHRSFLQNDMVRYRTKNGMMLVLDGEYTYIRQHLYSEIKSLER